MGPLISANLNVYILFVYTPSCSYSSNNNQTQMTKQCFQNVLFQNYDIYAVLAALVRFFLITTGFWLFRMALARRRAA